MCFSFFDPRNFSFSFSLFISFKFIEKKRFSTLISLSLSFSGFTSDEINFAFFLVGLTRANNISDCTFLLRSNSTLLLLFCFLSFVKFFFFELYKEFDLFFPLYLDSSSLTLFSLSLLLLILFELLLILVLLLVVLLGKVTCSVLFNFLGIFIRNLFFKYLQKFMLSLLIGLFI